jgi:CRP-like cAMP-binding protein
MTDQMTSDAPELAIPGATEVLSPGGTPASPMQTREVSAFFHENHRASAEHSAGPNTPPPNNSLDSKRVQSDSEGDHDEPAQEKDLPSIAQPLHRVQSFAIGRRGSQPTSQNPSPASYPRHLTATNSGTSTLVASPRGSPRAEVPQTVHNHLLTVPHLCTIPFEELLQLDIMTREYAPMDCILDAGSVVQHVYIIIQGAIDVFADAPIVGSKRVGRITAPNMFGMHNVLLDQKCKFAMRAGAHSVILLLLRDDFFRLLRKHKVFAHSVSPKIVDNLNVFQNFQTLCRAIFSISNASLDTDSYQLNMSAILKAYGMIWNGIHRGQHEEGIDYLAFRHALRRLPQNIVETYCLTLSRTLPPFVRKELEYLRRISPEKRSPSQNSREPSRVGDHLDSPGLHHTYSPVKPPQGGVLENLSFLPLSSSPLNSEHRPSPIVNIPTSDRRRKAYQIARGHTFVMVREGFTDVLDIVSCLCIFFIEGRKTRLRLQAMVAPTALDVLQDGLARFGRARQGEYQAIVKDVLSRLNFSKEEQDGLFELWPHSAIHRLNSLLTSREEMVVRLDTSLARRFDTDPYLQWALSLRKRVLIALGKGEGDTIPPTVVIDVLACNTHTPKNLLCRFNREHKDAILTWGKKNRASILAQQADWFNKDDLIYYLGSSMAQQEPEWRDLYGEALQTDGFVILEDPDMTGLQVDIIDMDRINPEKVDAILLPAFKQRKERCKNYPVPPRHFILNLDFAFGAQADGILRALILTFGFSIRSVNVISKCGGLRGQKGDIVLPDQLVFSKQVLGDDTPDEFRSAGNKDILRSRIEELAGSHRVVRSGPVLTIPGLVLQNEKVLKYYHRMWSCDGVEMEGSYYARQVEESLGLGMVRSDIVTRFGYHIVDLPLAGLAYSRVMGKPTALEAVPPMYALARAMLEQMILL